MLTNRGALSACHPDRRRNTLPSGGPRLGVRATPTRLLARLDERSVACHRLRTIPAVPDEDRRTLQLGGDRGRHGPDRSPRPRQGLCAGQDENGSLQPRQIARSLGGLPTAATLRAKEKPPSNHGKRESVRPARLLQKPTRSTSAGETPHPRAIISLSMIQMKLPPARQVSKSTQRLCRAMFMRRRDIRPT